MNVFGERFTDYVESVAWNADSTELTVTLRGGVPVGEIPEVGTIMVVDACGMFPFGFGATVNSVERNDKILLHCTPPDLSQFAESFELSTDDETLSAELVDIVDDNGDPIDYELVDGENGARASFGYGVDNKIVSIPFDISTSNGTAWDNLSFSGRVYCGFKHLGVRINKPTGGRMTTAFDIAPTAGISATTTVSGKVSATKNIRLGQMRFIVKGTIAGVPVILPVTFYIYFVAEASGEIKCELELSSEYNASYTVSDATGSWESVKNNDKKEASNPWAVGTLDLSGSISAGVKCGVMIGLYSSTVGVGLNITPKYTLSASASLSSENLYIINPEVDNTVEVESEVYCAARIFGKELGKYSYKFPSVSIFDESLHLLPGISDFKAECDGSTSAVVTYRREKRFFLEGVSADEGLVLLDENSKVLSYHQTSSTGETDGHISKTYTFSGLSPKTGYYVAPYYRVFGKTFMGEQKNIRTDDEIRKQRYRLTFLSCDGEPSLLPPVTTLGINVEVNSSKEILNLSFDDGTLVKYWLRMDKTQDYGDKIFFTKSFLEAQLYCNTGYDCINKDHNHTGDDDRIQLILRSVFEYYYVPKTQYESGVYRKKFYEYQYFTSTFMLPLASGIYTPCGGVSDIGTGIYGTFETYVRDCVFDASVRLELIEDEDGDKQ